MPLKKNDQDDEFHTNQKDTRCEAHPWKERVTIENVVLCTSIPEDMRTVQLPTWDIEKLTPLQCALLPLINKAKG